MNDGSFHRFESQGHMAETPLDLDYDGYCRHCEQYVGSATNQGHAKYCPGKKEVRPFTYPTGTLHLSFREWKQRVNSCCIRISGLGVDDLGDSDFWRSWDSGLLPRDMALQVLEENDFPFGEED